MKIQFKKKTYILAAEALLIIAGFGAADHHIVVSAENDVCTPVSVAVKNASVEYVKPSDKSLPNHWSNNSWGDHTAVFTYFNEGHSGGRSVKIEVSDYKDGDAKWFFDPVKLAVGDYTFSDYYRSNVDTKVVAAVSMVSGEIQYIDLPYAPSSPGWSRYEAVFSMPEQGETVTVYHMLSSDGYLITDNYDIRTYRYSGFDRGLVTITFDDGWEENCMTALPIMREFGFKSNQFYATTFIEHPWVSDPKERIMLFVEDGHEIGSHSVTHPDLAKLPGEQRNDELADSKAFLEKYLGVNIAYFATPYGSYNTNVNTSIMENYAAHRTVDKGYNSKDNYDAARLKAQSILCSTTTEEVAGWIDEAKREKLWLILLYHEVEEAPQKYDTTPEMFYEHMQAIKDAGIAVVTFSQALNELEGRGVLPGQGIAYIIIFAAAVGTAAITILCKKFLKRIWGMLCKQ